MRFSNDFSTSITFHLFEKYFFFERKLFIAFYFDRVVHQMWVTILLDTPCKWVENHVSQSYAAV